MGSPLALLGGSPVRTEPFPPHPVTGAEERAAVLDVLESNSFSAFIAAPGQFFLGGRKVKEFERRFAEEHGVAHAVTFNSATAALHAAVVAVGVEAGHEVIVPPYTFTSTATSVLMHNAIPVFADIEANYCCLDPDAVASAVTDLTQAIIPVHLFGQPADMDALMALAAESSLKVIEDCAQAPGATYKGKKAGTMGDCGIFSFTESKTMMTGEGGMLITDDEDIAKVAQMVRNHGEVILEGQAARTYRSDLLGWNYRMPEMEAAIGIVQLGRLPDLNRRRVELASVLSAGLGEVPGLEPFDVRPETEHVYYVYPFRFDAAKAGMPRARFVEAMAAEGIPLGAGYVRPLYLGPIYHEHRPSAFQLYNGNASYDKGLCPVTERLYEEQMLLTGVARAPATTNDMEDIVAAAAKVMEHAADLA